MLPAQIKDGVISTHTNKCLACGAKAEMWNVLGALCPTHKNNFVREFLTTDDLSSLDVVPDPAQREHLKRYIADVWKLNYQSS